MNTKHTIFTGCVLCALATLAVLGRIAMYTDATTSAIPVIPARVAMRGQTVGKTVVCRDVPIKVQPKLHLRDAVREEQLVEILCGALPLWNPPSVPSAFHELMLWGRECDFKRHFFGVERTGKFLLKMLLNNEACVANTALTGGDYLLDSPYGIHVIRIGTLDAVEYRGEAHYGQLLKLMGQVGIPSNTPVSTVSGRVGNLADVYQDAILRFALHEELEFIACALAYWHPPRATWHDQFGNEYSFDQLVQTLCAASLGTGACGGCHLPYAVATILRVDEDHPILSSDVRQYASDWLSALLHRLEDRQLALGGWDRSWATPGTTNFVYGDDLLDRITITGHHLEWICLIGDSDLRPSDVAISRAVAALHRDVLSLPPVEHRSFKALLPVSHAALALSLMRGVDPFSFWLKYWNEGRISRSATGFVVKQSQ